MLTSCAPCTGPTYTDKPNGLTQCTSCTVCDQGENCLKECLTTSNTVCGVLEGNYCTDFSEGECKKAEKHTTCKPGQFIRHPDGTCCTMCTPGYFVYTHCTRTDITVCVQCPNSTFTDKPHGRRICNPCTACNDDSGLKTVKECKPSSDAVCGVLEGNYCIDPYEGGCRAAKKHTTCKPGHFIKHPGTHSNDTVCENCPGNSFSDGTSTFCIPHTNCKAKRLSTVKAGDSVSDAECGERSRIPLIVVIIALVSVLVVIVGEVLKFKYKKIKIEPPLNGEYFCNLIKIIGVFSKKLC
uniref:TNFR-Cys domain-containing protein n=1 Tax=Scleropages formosus TaxID=113540 RepID=A0A8C9QWN6_SCLFO